MAPLLPGPTGRHSLAALLVACAIWAPAAMRDVQVGWQLGNGSTAAGSVIRVGALVRRCGTLLLPCAGLLDYHMSFFTELNSRRGGVLIGGVAHPLQLEAADVSDDGPEEAARMLVEEKGLRLLLGPLDPTISDVASRIVSQAGGVFVSPAAESGDTALPGVFTLGIPAARTFGSALRMFAGLGAVSALFIHSDDVKDVEKCAAASSIANTLGLTTQEVSISDGTWTEGDPVDVIVGCFREEKACYEWINLLAAAPLPHKAVVVDECPQYNEFLLRTQHNGQFVFSATLSPPHASVSSPLLNITNFGEATSYDLEGLTAMAAGEVLVTAIEAAGSVEPSAVSAAIQAGHFSTLLGSFRFNAFGAAEREAWVMQRQWSTEASVVSPPALAVVAPRYPHPDYLARKCFSDGNKRTDSGLSDPGDVESCTGCPVGQEAFTPTGELFQLCRPCAAGRHSSVWTGATCTKCEPGSFAEEAGQSKCDYCAPGRFMKDYNSTACEDCPVGQISRREGQSQCEACMGNGTRYASRKGLAVCEVCPEGAKCEEDEHGNVDVTNQLGWWYIEAENGSRSLLRCVHGANPEGRACQPGHQCISFEGEPLMEGAFCGTCRKDHGRVGAMDICQRCDQVGEGFLVLTTVLTCLLVLMTFVSNIVSKTRFKGTRTVVIKQIISYMIMVSVAFEYTDHKYPFGIGVGNLFRDLVSISGLRGGGLVRRAAQCLSWKLFPETQFWKACTICGCLIAPTMVATEFAVFKVLSLLMRVTGRKEPPWRHMMGFVTITLFVLLPRVNGLCLMPMNCFHFDQQRLLTDTEVLCNSDEHVAWQVIGYCGFMLNSLGIPLTLYLMLRFYNTRDMLEERSVINMLGFLYQGFEPHCYYFEVINMMRNVLVELAVDVPFLATQTPTDMNRLKCATLSILHGLFLFVHLTWQPYDNRMYFLLDRLETASLTATWSTTLLQTWLQVVRTTMRPGVDRDYSILQDVAGWLVFMLHLHFWGIIFCSILRSVVTAILARRTKAGTGTARRKRRNGNVLRRVYKRWMSPGNVVVTPNGFQLRALSEDAQRLYTQMFAELLDTLTEDGEHDWEMYLQAVQHVCINAYYQRIKTRKSGERPLLNMINNAQEVVKHLPCSDWLLNTLESIKDRIGSKDHEDPEVEHLQYLTEKNIANILGREFTVEELHCALLRLGSSVRDEKLSKAEAELMQASDSKTKTSLHRLMSLKTGRIKGSLLSADEDLAEGSEFYRATTVESSAATPQGPCPQSPQHWSSEVEVPRSVSPGWVEDRPPPLSGGKQIGSRESTFPEPEPLPADEEDPPPSPTKTRKSRPPAESTAAVSPQASPRPPDPAVPQLPSPTTPGGPQLPPVSAVPAVAPAPLPCGPIPEGKEQADEKELQSDGNKKRGTKQEMYVDMHRLALRADEVYSIFDEPKSVTKRMFGGLTRDHATAKESTESV